ncbi:MAG: hypothetical protein JNJ61_01325 [Anaerolineae bacterium]|nr:hypothetical protein [Anaerolineae bacterium]
MYTLIRSQSIKNLLTQQAPALLLAFFIAETFYKFRSFTLECAAFLVTWFVIDFILSNVLARLAKAQTAG